VELLTPLLKVEDFFELDFSKRILKNKRDERRVFISGAKAFATIQEGLYAQFPTDAPVILRQMGVSYGEALAKKNQNSEDQNTSMEIGIIADLQVLAAVAGWGKISISGDIAHDSEVNVIVSDCFFCSFPPSYSSKGPRCYFLVGVVQGVVDQLFPEEFIASESKCTSTKDKFCEIALRRRENTAQPYTDDLPISRHRLPL